MRIAQIAPLGAPVDPDALDVTSRAIAGLTEALVAQGHQVTLFASADSRSPPQLEPACPVALTGAREHERLAYEAHQVEQAFSRCDDFDVLHFHTQPTHLPLARRHPVPTVTTIYDPDSWALQSMLMRCPDVPLIATGMAQRRAMPAAHWVDTIYPAFSGGRIRFAEEPLPQLACVPPSPSPHALDDVMAVARGSGVPVTLLGPLDSQPALSASILLQPRCDPQAGLIRRLDPLEPAAAWQALATAAALLVPGCHGGETLIAIHALAFGTPVIAWRTNAAAEVVDHGRTGFIVNDAGEAIQSVYALESLSRLACRCAFDRQFEAHHGAHAHVGVYQRVIAEAGSRRSAKVATIL